MKLEDLLPDYPAVDDPRLQAELAARPEFAELQGSSREPVPPRGEYYTHQRAVLRYLRIYDRLFLVHRMGAGKTCAMGSVGSFFKNKHVHQTRTLAPGAAENLPLASFGPTLLPPPGALISDTDDTQKVGVMVDALVEFMSDWDNEIKHCFILVKGPTLRAEFERQLACECAAPNEYAPTPAQAAQAAASASPEDARRNQVRAKIRKFFTVDTYGRFVSQYLTRSDQGQAVLISPAEMRRRFNNCLFIVDEVHSLYNEARDGASKKKEMSSFKFAYNGLHTLFHTAEHIKVILASGTPMINDANEIKSEMNLILPLDRQMAPGLDVNQATLAEMEPYFRGLTSFVRELDTGADLELQGQHFKMIIDGKERESVDTVYITTMSAFQTKAYENVSRKAKKTDEEEDEEEAPEDAPLGLDMSALDEMDLDTLISQISRGTAPSVGSKQKAVDLGRGQFHSRELNAAAFVFPDGSIEGKVRKSADGTGLARSGLGRYVYSPGRNKYVATPEFFQAINTLPKLKRLSSVVGAIVEDCKTHPGKKFVYTPKVQGGGAIVMEMAFEANGWTRFDTSESVISGAHLVPKDSDGSSSCRRGGSVGSRRILIAPARRCALFTGDLTEKEAAAILELWSAPENVHGEYLEVLIGSPIARDGINLPETLRVHLFSGWNASGTAQALGRVDRSNAYVLLLPEAQARAAAEGKNPSEARVEVKVFKHAAVPDNSDVESIDLKLYAASERKDREIKRVERFIMQSSFDCHLHRRRNIRSTDKEGSAACAYGSCSYECAAPLTQPEKEAMPAGAILGTSTTPTLSAMLLTSSSRKLDLLGEQLLAALVDLPEARLDKLAHQFGTSMEWVALAADRLMRSRRVVLDRWGFPCTVLAPPGGMITLHRSFSLPAKADPWDGYYTSHLALVDAHLTLETAVQSGPINVESVDDLAKLSVLQQMQVLEAALIRAFSGGEIDPVLAWFERSLWAIREPTADLARAEQDLARRGTGRGRKSKIGAALRLKSEVSEAPPGSVLSGMAAVHAVVEQCAACSVDHPWVFVHTLDSKSNERTSYAVAAQLNNIEGRLRIWDQGWRDATLTETPVYKTLIQRARDEVYQSYGDLYGSILDDGKFRIHDRGRAVGSKAAGPRNKREEARGKVCETWSVPQLILVAARAGVQAPDPAPKKISAAQTRQLADWSGENDLSGDTARLAWAWWNFVKSNDGLRVKEVITLLCEELEDRFRATGKLDVV